MIVLAPEMFCRKSRFYLVFFKILNKGLLYRFLQVVSEVLKLAEFSKVAELLAAISKIRGKYSDLRQQSYQRLNEDSRL